jgi:hypothetical protein
MKTDKKKQKSTYNGIKHSGFLSAAYLVQVLFGGRITAQEMKTEKSGADCIVRVNGLQHRFGVTLGCLQQESHFHEAHKMLQM